MDLQMPALPEGAADLGASNAAMALATPLVGAGGVGAPPMTPAIVVATFAAPAVYLLGPRRYPGAPAPWNCSRGATRSRG
jgi:hypothetical protein